MVCVSVVLLLIDTGWWLLWCLLAAFYMFLSLTVATVVVVMVTVLCSCSGACVSQSLSLSYQVLLWAASTQNGLPGSSLQPVQPAKAPSLAVAHVAT